MPPLARKGTQKAPAEEDDSTIDQTSGIDTLDLEMVNLAYAAGIGQT